MSTLQTHMTKDEVKAHASKLKGTVIALVNPRLQSFKHPLALAAAIVTVSMPIVVALIVVGLQDCVEECSTVPLSETGTYETCKTVQRKIPDIETTLKPAFSYLAKDSKYRIVESHEGRAQTDGSYKERSTMDDFLNEQSTKKGWGLTFLAPTSRLIPYAFDGSFGENNILGGLTFVPPTAEVLSNPAKHSWSHKGPFAGDDADPDETVFSWELVYDVDPSSINAGAEWTKGAAAPNPTQPLRPDGDLITAKAPRGKDGTSDEITDTPFFDYTDKDFDVHLGWSAAARNSNDNTKAAYLFLKKPFKLHKKYGLASEYSSQRLKVPEQHSRILKQMKIQFIREDPESLNDVPSPYDGGSVSFYARNSRYGVDREIGLDFRRKLKVCWVYEDKTQVCMSFNIDDFATQIASNVCADDLSWDMKSKSFRFLHSTSPIPTEEKICVHAFQDCSDALPKCCKSGYGFSSSDCSGVTWPAPQGINEHLHEVVTTSIPWFFENTWNYSSPLMAHRSKLNCPAGDISACPLSTLCENYPNGPGVSDSNNAWEAGQKEREIYDGAFDPLMTSITNPFPNVCEMHMYLNNTGNNVKYTTLNDLEKMHKNVNTMTMGQKFEYQVAQYSGAIHAILQSPEYLDLAAVQADTVTTYCCNKVCPAATTAVGAALGRVVYSNTRTRFIRLNRGINTVVSRLLICFF